MNIKVKKLKCFATFKVNFLNHCIFIQVPPTINNRSWWWWALCFCRDWNDHQLPRSFYVGGIFPSMIPAALLCVCVCAGIDTLLKNLREVFVSGYF